MRIAQSAVQLRAAHEATSILEVEEHARLELGPAGPDAIVLSGEAALALEDDARAGRLTRPVAPEPVAADEEVALTFARPPVRGIEDTLDALSEAAAQALRSDQPAEQLVDDLSEAISDLELQIVIALFERMTGHKMHVIDGAELQRRASGAGQAPSLPSASAEAAPTAEQAPSVEAVDFSFEYHRRETLVESESLRFEATAVVETGDGRRIEVLVNLGLDRKLVQEKTVDVLAGRAAIKKDPLVLHFDGPAVALADRTFRFDLDADGVGEDLHFVAPGSAFLAVDRDGSGAVEDGTELFGARTGDGFGELAAHDGDANGWIDEGDAIWSRLRLWSSSSDGQQQLLGLGSREVGAIYLGKVSTPFSFRGADNRSVAELAATGIYLREDGEAGAVHHLDLVI